MNVELQVIGSALRAVAEEMGAVLIRSAFSANIKERRDCSTAVFDEAGRMIAQAEHIPVHLGAMPDAVVAAMTLGLTPGEVCILNDPFTGGTHLPDVTLVSRTALGYAVSRAHHADVGGMEPASLPAFSHELYQEGLIIPPVRLTDEVLTLFVANARNPQERRGDLRAQMAAHRLAERRIDELCSRRGRARVAAAMDELYAYSERMVRAAIARLPDGRWSADDVVEAVEGDLAIRCTVEVRGEEVHIDFAGTAAQHRGNLNCPLAVTRSACYYVVRCLTEPDLPASGGAFAPVRVTAPEGSLVNAHAPAAVVAGNTETSSRIVDVVFRAFGEALPVPAQGQGTMNNVALGNDRFTYYETIGGGQGACPDADGPSGVHVAMSNTLMTPVEALELSYPLRVERWQLRLGSGGAGAHRGGDGVVRELRVLEDCRLSVLAERRAHAPRGARGGDDGAPGRTLVNGEEQPAKVTTQLAAGDVLRIETPGGGGFGRQVVGAIIVNDEGHAFVHRRGDERALFPGCWDFPGGHLEAGETALEALQREVHEETGWRLTRVVAELGESVWVGNDGIERRELDYLIEVEGDLTAPRLERPKHVEFSWVGLDDLDRLMEHRAPEEVLVRDTVERGILEAQRLRGLSRE